MVALISVAPLADIVYPEPVISHQPWLGAFLAVTVLVVVGGGMLIARDIIRAGQHRAELAGYAERQRTGLEAALNPQPAFTVHVSTGRHVDPREAVDTGYVGRRFAEDMPTQVLILPRLAGVPAWIGAARVPLSVGRQFLAAIRVGWWKA